MLIVLFVICCISIGIGFIIGVDDEGSPFAVLGGVGSLICVIAAACMSITLSKTIVINDRIAMYKEENAVIEQQIDTVVKEYMAHEGETFKNLKSNSSMTLVSLYPELKSDELVKTQIDTYQKNNETIKSLKDQKIKAGVWRWWLYFGK